MCAAHILALNLTSNLCFTGSFRSLFSYP